MSDEAARTEREVIDEAVLHFRVAVEHSRLDTTQVVVLDGMAMRLLAGVDSLTRLPSDRLDSLFGETWHDMRGMRNRIAHGYGVFNHSVTVTTVTQELPEVLRVLQARLDELGS